MNPALIAVVTFIAVFLGVWQVASSVSRRRGQPNAAPGTLARVSRTQVAIVLAVAAIVTLLTVVAVTKAAAWLLDPLLAALGGWSFQLVLRPWGAALLGLIALLVGWPFAKRFRSPSRFKTGVALVSVALITFWPLQYVVSRFELQFSEWEAALHIAAGLFSLTLLSGGLETMRRANNTPADDSWEFWR